MIGGEAPDAGRFGATSVPRTVSIVFSQPPPGVPDEDFEQWYDAHLLEMLAIPGFLSAQRFRIEPEVAAAGASAAYRFAALFEFDGDPAAMQAAKEAAQLTTRESYVELKKMDVSGPPLPPWWDGVTFASWTCIPTGERSLIAPLDAASTLAAHLADPSR
jgi:hypothetical protein